MNGIDKLNKAQSQEKSNSDNYVSEVPRFSNHSINVEDRDRKGKKKGCPYGQPWKNLEINRSIHHC